MKRKLLAFCGISGFLSVLAGAAAAHWLAASMPPDAIARTEKAATYQMYHTLALLAIATSHASGKWLSLVAGCFITGIFLFSGSLYAYSFTGLHMLIYVTPLGGFCLMAGWFCLVTYSLVKK